MRRWLQARRERRLLREGQRLASQRDDLIARGIHPAKLAIPIAPPLPPRTTKGER